MRLDQWLVAQGKVPSRAKAQELITSGAIKLKINNKLIHNFKPSMQINDEEKSGHIEIEITDNSLVDFVSRGGVKLRDALEHLNLSVRGLSCLDLGQSTGGFTDCLLKKGAHSIVGIDVGHDQLHLNLRNHPQVQFFEGFHVLELIDSKISDLSAQRFDLVVGDLSFISTEVYLPALEQFMISGQKLLMLIKPQFEAQRSQLSKKGLVDEDLWHLSTSQKIREKFDRSFKLIDFFACSLKGQEGNQEYFLFGERK